MLQEIIHFMKKQSDVPIKDEMEKTKKALADSYVDFNSIGYFSKMLDKLGCGVWSKELNGNVFVSEGIKRIVGENRSDLLANRHLWEKMIVKEDLEEYLKKKKQLANGVVLHHQYRIINTKGEIRWIEDYTVPILDEKGNLVRLDGVMMDISNQKKLEQEAKYNAHHDYLTGLSNRTIFENNIDNFLAKHTKNNSAVFIFHLSRIQYINETFGSHISTQIIQQFAERIKQLEDVEEQYLSRLSDHQFALFLPHIKKINKTYKLAQTMIEQLEKPLKMNGYDFFCPIKVGISLYPFDSKSAEQMIRNAEIALNRCIENETNQVEIYSKLMKVRPQNHFQLEKDLQKAIENNELFLQYQPIVDANKGIMIGAEALLRWNHPEFGLLLPGDFISIAEENHLIIEISDWVIRTVCQQIAKWKEMGFSIVPISINISPKSLLKVEFADHVINIIKKEKIDPSWLEFEITETTLIKNQYGVRNTMEKLKEVGVKFSLDDFGTGFSSFNYLRQFKNIDTLKIDSSFIHKVDQDWQLAAIVKSMILLANGLKMTVLAEGVETVEQLQFLLENQCTKIQGYLFSKPLIKEEFEKLLQNRVLRPVYEMPIGEHKVERRKYFRLPFTDYLEGTLTIKNVKGRAIKSGITTIKIKNIGANGLCFQSSFQFPVRENVVYEFAFAFSDVDWTFEGIIVWKREVEHLMEYGVKFLIDENQRSNLIKCLNQELLKQKKIR